jgi:hypothetical protein
VWFAQQGVRLCVLICLNSSCHLLQACSSVDKHQLPCLVNMLARSSKQCAV